MNRREFIQNSFYSILAYSLGACGKTTKTEQTPMNHGAMSHDMITQDSPATGIFDVSRLVKGETLRSPKPLIFEQQAAVLNVLPVQRSWCSDGAATMIWAYQDRSGMSMLDVNEGDTVRIEVRNQLSEATTVHWHGVDVPADQDGHPSLAIEPQKSRVYTFSLPIGSAATYWYHPHPHGRTSAQVSHGLGAPFIVRTKDDPIAALGVPEQLLMFTVFQFDVNAQVAAQTLDEQINGRDGNVLLVNGQYQPVWTVQLGSMHRLRLINASNARYLRLSFGDTPMVVVGTDGGLLERPLAPQKEVLLAPAERIEACVTFTQDVTLQALPYDKGWMDSGMGGQRPVLQALKILSVTVVGEKNETPQLPAKLRRIEPLGAATITRRIVMTENMQMSMINGKHNMTMEFMINNRMFDAQRIDFTARQNEVELWEIVNQTDMDHPFHIHGSQFQIISTEENGVVTHYPYLAWKDTVNTRPNQTVRIKIKQTQKGIHLFHCHILEHEDLGMMGQYNVV